MMEYVLLFAGLVAAIPTPATHKFSSYSTQFERVRKDCGQPPEWGPWDNQSSSSGYDGQIFDNGKLKYLLPITVGGQTLKAELDTGSADTWLIQTGFQCWDTFDIDLQSFTGPEDPSVCNFGPTYTPGSEFTPIDLFERSCYGQTESTLRCVAGQYGTADVDMNGLTIPNVILGAPLNSSFPAQGGPFQSGLIGLSFSASTDGMNETDSQINYPPIMQQAFEVDDLPIAKEFTIALSRDESSNNNGGTFTIGGIPDLTDPSINASSSYVSAPWQFVPTRSNTSFTFYSIIIDNFVVGDQTASPNFQILVDSGADTFETSPEVAQAINGLWSPPISDSGTLPCDATLSEPVGVTISGTTFYIQAQDLLGPNTDGTCSSLVSAGEGGEFLIGDPLLKNTLVVFDWAGRQLSFYERMYYES